MDDRLMTADELTAAVADTVAHRRAQYGREGDDEYFAAGLYTGLAVGRYAPEKAALWLRSFEAAVAEARGVTPEQQEVEMRAALASEVEP